MDLHIRKTGLCSTTLELGVGVAIGKLGAVVGVIESVALQVVRVVLFLKVGHARDGAGKLKVTFAQGLLQALYIFTI